VSNEVLINLCITIGLLLALWLGVKLIASLRKKRTNTELWATVFEGLTHKTMNLEPLKAPEIHIEKKARRDGQDKDPALAALEEK
jgi:hypothetical protein